MAKGQRVPANDLDRAIQASADTPVSLPESYRELTKTSYARSSRCSLMTYHAVGIVHDLRTRRTSTGLVQAGF